jgi:hypothetical protein
VFDATISRSVLTVVHARAAYLIVAFVWQIVLDSSCTTYFCGRLFHVLTSSNASVTTSIAVPEVFERSLI